tara:strand:+ start:1411 stop:1710 length:300 start_codon:yes stop_codon:yes gene_type:complete
MTTTWVITQTNYETSNGFITTAHWTATAVDGDYTASIWSTCSWQAGTPTIPYANVTEAEVLAWCYASGVDKDATEAALAQQIALQKNPVTATGTPWATA